MAMQVTVEEMFDLIGRFEKGEWNPLEGFISLMAGSKSNYLSKKVLDLPLGASAFSAPANVFAGLWTASLADGSTSATAGEAAYTSYARVSITNNSTNFPNATGATTATKNNGTAITFPASTGSTATVISFGLFDVASGAGNLLYWCDVTSTVISSGDTPQVAINGLTVVED